MNVPAVRAQLDAIRAQLDALEVALAGEADSPARPVDCEHPEDKREPAAVSGAPRQYLCRACVQLINPDAPEGAGA